MTGMKLGALVAVAVGMACGPPVVRVHLDRSTVPAELDADEVEQTLAAAVDWWSGCGFDVAIDATADPVRFEPIDDNKIAIATTRRDGGVRILNWGRLWVTDTHECIGQMRLGRIMRHELGHLVGQQHEPEEWSVMFESQNACEDQRASERCHPP